MTESTPEADARDEAILSVVSQALFGASLFAWDVSRPFWHELGLNDVSADLVADVRPVLDEFCAQRSERVDLDLFAMLELGIGDRWPSMSRWLDHVFVADVSDAWGWGVWLWLIEDFDEAGAWPRTLGPEQKSAVRHAFAQLRDATDMSDIDAQMKGLRADPFTDWDVANFVNLGLNPYQEDRDPYDLIKTNVLIHRLRQEAIRLLSSPDGSALDEHLHAAAQQFSDSVDGEAEPIPSLSAVVADWQQAMREG